MAGRAEVAHGSDRATKIMKYDGLPSKGKLKVEEFKDEKTEIPVLGSFISTMSEGGVDLSPLSNISALGDKTEKPRFTAKITLFDSHSNDNY